MQKQRCNKFYSLAISILPAYEIDGVIMNPLLRVNNTGEIYFKKGKEIIKLEKRDTLSFLEITEHSKQFDYHYDVD